MRTDLTRVLRKGLHEPGYYKNTYLQARRVMVEYERRLDDLVWACQLLRRLGDHPDITGRAIVILMELGLINRDQPKKCLHCQKVKGQHKANTFHCPAGARTRVGYTRYDPDRVFTERPRISPSLS